MVKSLTSEVEVDIYDIIFKRKSIRKYNNSPLDESVLTQISEEINNLTPLYDDIKGYETSPPLPCNIFRKKRGLLD
jgi:hypothetical protein